MPPLEQGGSRGFGKAAVTTPIGGTSLSRERGNWPQPFTLLCRLSWDSHAGTELFRELAVAAGLVDA